MKKIAAICGPALGHVGRLATACYALTEHTEVSIDFIYPQQSAYPEKVLDSRFRQLPLPGQGKSFLERSATFSEHLNLCFHDADYDLIVHDANPMAWLSMLGFPACPRVNITNAFLTSMRPAPTVQEVQFDKCYQRLNGLRASRGLEPLASAYELYEADKVLLADPAPIVRLLGEMPDHFIQCGACSWSMKGPVPKELDALKNILLISMGSTGTSDFEVQLLKQLRKFVGSNTIVYAGSKQEGLNKDDDIQHCYKWLPLDEVLTRCKAVIAQGGAGSSYQALIAGCPVIVVPTHRNHRILGNLIQRLGVGVCLGDPQNSQSISEQFEFQVLCKQASDFAQAVRLEDGPNAIAREILELL